METLKRTIASVHAEMSRLPLFPYTVEVVVEVRTASVHSSLAARMLAVPKDFKTPRGSLYKARALAYALAASPVPDNAWIFHMDEESEVTASLIRGIRDAVEQEERQGTYRIGQGAILYHRSLRAHPVLTLVDSLRTGDDMGRFYLQNWLGINIFGLHGSFVLVRNSVEKDIGFDFGPEGSITEDLFWAQLAADAGYGFRWVDGHLVEQSPLSLADFLRQRRRWFVGFKETAKSPLVSLPRRAMLAVLLALWALTALVSVTPLLRYLLGLDVAPSMKTASNALLSVAITQYMVGLRANLAHANVTRRWRYYVAQVPLVFLASVLESAAVVYAIARPDTRGYFVVKKEMVW